MKNSNNGMNEPNQETSNFPFVVHKSEEIITRRVCGVGRSVTGLN